MTNQQSESQWVDLVFMVHGTTIPADHGYPLFSAISMVLPTAHASPDGQDGFAILPINGRLAGDRRLSLTPESRLVLRVRQDHVAGFLVLAGKTLPLPGSPVAVGVPHVSPLEPSRSLVSRMVTIKVRDVRESAPEHAEEFLAAARRKIGEMGIRDADVQLCGRSRDNSFEGKQGADLARSPWIRRTVVVRGKRIVGYALKVSGLSPADSLKLQVEGLGGRRHFGCGVFVPARGPEQT